MKFYLGTHLPKMMYEYDIPLMYSRNLLYKIRGLKQSLAPIWVDSGAFTELTRFGYWSITEREYIRQVKRIIRLVVNVEYLSPMDYMCEPFILKKTGLTIEEHIKRTVHNFVSLRMMDSDLPFVPVLQGWKTSDYLRCADMYYDMGIDLQQQTVVAVGTVCKRQGKTDATQILNALAHNIPGIRMHGFGFSKLGILENIDVLYSADSAAWSYTARRNNIILPECTHSGDCRNCDKYAMQWYNDIIE